MSSTPLRHKSSGIPVLVSSRIPSTSSNAFPVPETPLKHAGRTRIPIPITPQAEAPVASMAPIIKPLRALKKGKATRYAHTVGNLHALFTGPEVSTTHPTAIPSAQKQTFDATHGFSKPADMNPTQSVDVLRARFTSNQAGEAFISGVREDKPLVTTTIHRKYERFEEFIAVQKKHGRNEALAEGIATSNKYRRIEDTSGNSYRTILPVPSGLRGNSMAKTPMPTNYSRDLRDAYTADMTKTPINGCSRADTHSPYTASMRTPMATMPTPDLRTAYKSGLCPPITAWGKRLPASIRANKASNGHTPTMKTTSVNYAPIIPGITREGGTPMPNKKRITNLNASAGITVDTHPLELWYPPTPGRNDKATAANAYVTPHKPQTKHFSTPAQSTPLDYEKIPLNITVVNGVQRSVGHDERFPILRRVRKAKPPAVGESMLGTGEDPTNSDKDVAMADG